jgi:hypothetical protein
MLLAMMTTQSMQSYVFNRQMLFPVCDNRSRYPSGPSGEMTFP